ncbi:mannitol dehydrogenase family protein [Cryptosporangium aurantiacum]|uniref:Mannitol-1-phosphate 5-dehydrogenase n=1 Tax=Cryptosporangium aurantiacum TaxID=134849 RepID=A0A1M7PC94_9ACTN|nr:mannitol dehydrogenase family protein [Cryptosporangium aurantiacum]SHN14546.1 fructuronate reductase [Cryptosporangium aurantiacum]
MTTTPARLRRTAPPPPARILHLGLGSFFRAHQAWYTATAPDAHSWGITAFTGRSTGLAESLTAQDGLYTLVKRWPEGDTASVVASVVAAHPGADTDAWVRAWRSRELAVVTLTVTEAGYLPNATVAERLVSGLAARRTAGGGPLAVVPCDNLPANGEVVRRVVTELAESVDPTLARWITDHVSFVTTMVDRITPATTPDDVNAAAELTGVADAAPVFTEPYTEWVLSGDFPAGRPLWEESGARFVADVEPHEQRKLWLLNGGHSLLAYAGSAVGHETVADAVTDPACRRWLDQWWDEAARYLPLPPTEITAYRGALLDRWANPRIQHRLAQIATDGSQKIPVRVLPVVRAARAAHRMPTGAIRILAAWIRHLHGAGAPVRDAGAAPFAAATSPRDVLALFDPALAADEDLVAALEDALRGH